MNSLSVVGCDDVSVGDMITTFGGIIVPSSSGSSSRRGAYWDCLGTLELNATALGFDVLCTVHHPTICI